MNESLENDQHFSQLKELFQNHPELQAIYERSASTSKHANLDESGYIVSDGHTYDNTPRMRAYVALATAIRESLPPVKDGHVRLWRGNRPDEVGHNPSYTNSLEGFALPFLKGYQGVLSYVDIPAEEVKKYLTSGAKDSEFILPADIVSDAHIVGFSTEEANEKKKQAKPLTDSNQSDGLSIVPKWPS